MVGPLHGRFVAHRQGADNVGIPVGQINQFLNLSLVGVCIFNEPVFGITAAPGTTEVVQLGTDVCTEHHF